MAQIDVKVPDIGDFKDVPVISVFVKPGDTVKAEDPLIELESRQGHHGGALAGLGHGRRGEGQGGRPRLGRRAGAHARRRGRGGRGGAAHQRLRRRRHRLRRARRLRLGGAVETITVSVPDIGDFKDVPVITVFVKAGDTVKAEDPLVELESDKATMEVPSPDLGHRHRGAGQGGRQGRRGHRRSSSSPPAWLRSPPSRPPPIAAPASRPTAPATGDLHAELLVLGSGPGGYTAAFRAADLGLQTVLVERNPTLGGVCLNVGCIPSKALLHAAKVITEAEEMAHFGIKLGEPDIDIDALRGWKESVVKKLTGGLSGLAKGRKVQVVEGVGQFAGPNLLERRDQGRAQDHQLRPVHRRRRLGAGEAALHPARRPAGDRLRPARSSSAACRSGCWSSAAASSGWRWPASTTRSAPR